MVLYEEAEEVIVHPPLVNFIKDDVGNARESVRVVNQQPQQIAHSHIEDLGIFRVNLFTSNAVTHGFPDLLAGRESG